VSIRELNERQLEREPAGHLAGNIAHDLNNLLMIVAGSCERLSVGNDLSERHRREIDRIVIAVNHASSLTQQLLAGSRGASARSGTTDLAAALVQTARLLEHSLGPGITLEMDLTPRPTWVRMSEGAIAQVLINLAINARDAMPDGGLLKIVTDRETLDAASAEARGLPAGEYVRLVVRDTGTGMTAETQARAFDRLFTTKPAGRGTGLGLASVRWAVEQCGGSVNLHSATGEGTTFTILVPMAVEAPFSAATDRTNAPLGTSLGETVLVVDDEAVVREIVAAMLRDFGYHVIEAASADEALAWAESGRRIDLLVADIAMQDVNGLELARRFTAVAPDIKLLFMSGYDDRTQHAEACDVQGAFLQKPFTSSQLGQRVREVLESCADTVDDSLIQSLPTAVFVVADQRFAYVNAAFAGLLALAPRELIDHALLERIHPDDRNVAPGGSAAGDSDSHAATTQIRMRGGDGAERSLLVATVPFSYRGRPALLGTAIDVTLQPDVLNVSVRMAALGRLAGGIAHDFNNLLLVIGGQIERLERTLATDREARGAIDTIAAASDRAAMLTDQLLSFGRRQMLAPQVMDLSAFIASVESELRARVGSEVRLVVDRAGDVPTIRADGPRLREVLWHLADNARDAMPSGGTLTIAVDRIVVDAALRSRWAFLALGSVFVRLRVIDTGSGMNPEVVPHVFEPFFTTKGRGRGAGMGLASVYGIVKQSAGYVFVERSGGDGTCVSILLPLAVARDDGQRPRTEAAPAAAGNGRHRVLLVEDDVAVRELLTDVLVSSGFDVLAAETAEQAELKSTGQSFDVLVSDIDLPGASGARLASSLATQMPGMRVILMSGYPDDGEIAAARLEQTPILLRKPFSMTSLVDHIRDALA
jgi:PAS domain S-box-containing protein